MANPTLTTTFATPQPDANPLNLTQLFQLANFLVSTTFNDGDFLNVTIRSDEPGPEQRDTLWVVTDSSGRPTSLKVWHPASAHWRRVYNGMVNEIRGFTGAPGYGPAPALFMANGLGNIGLEYDGWHICNGSDGTPDLSNRFIVGADMSAASKGYTDEKWKTKIDAADGSDPILSDEGGQWTEVIQPKNLPIPPLLLSKMDRYKIGSGGETVDIGGLLWGENTSSTQQHVVPGHPDDNYKYPGTDFPDAGETPEGLFIGPPFYSLAWIMFVGYA